MVDLETSIKNRVDEIFDCLFEKELTSIYEEYMRIISSIPNVSPEIAFEMENLFILMIRERIGVSYRKGLRAGLLDGLNTNI